MADDFPNFSFSFSEELEQNCLFNLDIPEENEGNQLVSYTRQMELVGIGDQAKFENSSLRTKHFRILLFIFLSVSFLKMRFRILLGLLYAPNPFGAYRAQIDYQNELLSSIDLKTAVNKSSDVTDKGDKVAGEKIEWSASGANKYNM